MKFKYFAGGILDVASLPDLNLKSNEILADHWNLNTRPPANVDKTGYSCWAAYSAPSHRTMEVCRHCKHRLMRVSPSQQLCKNTDFAEREDNE